MSGRVISSSLPTSLASLIICLSVNGLVSPSWVIASIAFTSPIRKPNRAPGQQVGGVRHRLHPAGDADLEVAGADRLVGEPDRPHPRGADLVDRLRGHLLRDPGLDLRLARGDLALAGLQHLAEDHLLDLRRRRPRRARAPPRSPRRRAPVASFERERAAHLPERGAGGAEDDCLGHRSLSALWTGAAEAAKDCLNASDRARDRTWFGGQDALHRLARRAGRGHIDADRRARRRPRRRRARRGRLAARRARRGPGRRRRQAGLQEARRCCIPSAPARALVVGLGDPRRARRRAPAGRRRAGREARREPRGATRSPGWSPPGGDAGERAAALVEGTVLAAYRFDRFRSRRRRRGFRNRRACERIVLVADDGVPAGRREVALVAAEAANRARDLQNLPANELTPAALAARAEELAAAHDAVEVDVLDREAIAAKGMGGLIAVSQGSATEPRLIALRYSGGGSGPRLGLVGKARDLRQRRDLDQALGGDARDEDGHVGRRRRDRGGGRDRRARARGRPGRGRARRPRTCRAGPRSSPAT